ncbi:hypothetical protein P7C70_g748, partial [Phenoliferia sp. Uapishka_3]
MQSLESGPPERLTSPHHHNSPSPISSLQRPTSQQQAFSPSHSPFHFDSAQTPTNRAPIQKQQPQPQFSARQSIESAQEYESEGQRSFPSREDGLGGSGKQRRREGGSDNSDRSQSASRPTTSSSFHRPPSQTSSPYAFAQHASSPHPPHQRAPSDLSTAERLPNHSYNPNTTPQQNTYSQPYLFSSPSDPNSTSSPPQTLYATTPRAPLGASERPLNGMNGSTDQQGRSSGDYRGGPSHPSQRGLTQAALNHDSLLGPAPSSAFNSDRGDARARALSPPRAYGNSSATGNDPMGRNKTSSENGSGNGGVLGSYHHATSPAASSSAISGQFQTGMENSVAQKSEGGQQNGGSGSSGFSGGSHPSSSSLSSSAGLMSPLSPHVEPFSPATSTNGGSWGTSAGKAFGQHPNTTIYRNDSTVHDFRSPQTAQQHQSPQHATASPFTRNSLPSFSPNPNPASSSYISLQQQQASSSAASLGGPPEHDFLPSAPLPFPPNNYEVPGLPPLNTSLAPLSNYFGPGPALNPVPVSGGGIFGSEADFGYGNGGAGASGSGNPYGASTGPGSSREGYNTSAITGLGLQAPRREIPMDRGGYVRAGYSSETTTRGLGVNATGAQSVLGDGLGFEEISTIFVVGFPEDMLEREFQNMFVFSTGFEAATLKIPASTVAARERDREIANAAAVNAAVGNASGNKQQGPPSTTLPLQSSSQAQSAYLDPYGGMLDGASYEDAFGNLPLDGPGSLAQVLGGMGRDAAGSPAGTRKQIIGFAKFRTRTQALDARDILSGKKVDAEKGCILKAEMAKKNLHTKRGLSNELIGGASFPLSSLDSATLGRLATATNLNPAVLAELARQSAAQQANQQQSPTIERDSRDSFNSQPSPAIYSSHSTRERESSGGGGGYAKSSAGGSVFGGGSRDYYEETTSPIISSASYYNPSQSIDSFGHSYSQDHSDHNSSPDFPSELTHSPNSSSSVQTSSPHLRGAVAQAAYSGNSMMQQLDAGMNDGHRTFISSLSPSRTFNSSSQYNGPEAGGYGADYRERPSGTFGQPAYPGFPPGPMSTSGVPPSLMAGGRLGSISGPSMSSLPTSPLMGVSHSGNGIPRTQNPADMNSPKNTLYVGGLPAVLPSLTGPFSAAHLEDSLRNAFSRCPGFRRLCFRSKSNGPIVFVEFDDVIYATQALQDMYGHTLGGLIKGGIRLSYSKNPLGVRSGGPNGSPLPPPLSDGPFNAFGNNSPLMHRRPSESVFGMASPSMLDHRSSIPRSPPSATPSQSTFSPFSYEH